MCHPEPQPHYNPGKVQIQVQPTPFRAISEVDARKTCMQLSPTFSEHRRKLFIKYFLEWEGEGASNPGEADVALFCHVVSTAAPSSHCR